MRVSHECEVSGLLKPQNASQRRPRKMLLFFWTLFAVNTFSVRGFDDGYLARFVSAEDGLNDVEIEAYTEAFELAAGFRSERGRRFTDCDCGEGTVSCRVRMGRKICECENNSLVIDYHCKGCCANGICDGSSDCDCKRGYALNIENTCEECKCGASHQCHFYEGDQYCNCWNQFISMNIKCADCKCGQSEYCYGRQEVRTCPCSNGSFFPECEECDCSLNHSCSYIAVVAACKCFPNYARLNETCTECRCTEKNSKCDFVHGIKTCSCKEGFEEHNGICEECYCGNGHSCTFKNGSSVCICQENYMEHNGSCKECACKEGENCEFVDGKGTCICKENHIKVDGFCTECFCGDGHGCDIIRGKKLCICKKNFADKNGICEECKCGPGHACEFLNGKKECSCTPGYAERNGTCFECSCGNNSACMFYGEEKECICTDGYVEKNGMCHEVCHEDTCHSGRCQVDGDTFRCNCDNGYTGQRCDHTQRLTKEAGYLIATLVVVTSFWITLVAAYVIKRRRRRYQDYSRQKLDVVQDDMLILSVTYNVEREQVAPNN